MRRIILFMFALSSFVEGVASEPFRQVISSASGSVNLDHWKLTNVDLRLDVEEQWSVRKYSLRGGKQEGVDLIEVNNGRLKITIIPTRGMGILRVEAGETRLEWDSPVKEVVHPRHINLESRGGLGWLEGFNEWMVRCGLEFAGHPGTDKFISNTGDEAEMILTLHGKVANIPASEVEVVIDRKAPYRIRVRGRVDERMFFGPKLELWTELSTVPGSDEFRVQDTLTNHGAYDQEFQLIYHTNFGSPLLEGGSRFVGPIRKVVPFNAHAAKDVREFDSYLAPKAGFIEQVYCMYPQADRRNRTVVLLHNSAADKGVSMEFSLDELPYFTLWKNTTALEEGYVTGLEPGTGFPFNRSVERKFGRVPKLKPEQSRTFTLLYGVHSTATDVQGIVDRISQIQGTSRPVIELEPAELN